MNTWGLRGTAAAVGVAAVIAGAGGAAIDAATGSDVHVMGAHSAPPRPGGPPQHDGLDAPALHGESVVSDGNGGFTTELSQTGTITAIDATSVSVRSADGYRQAYVIPAAATAPPFNVGDQVTIHATRNGADATVTTIRPPLH